MKGEHIQAEKGQKGKGKRKREKGMDKEKDGKHVHKQISFHVQSTGKVFQQII